MDWFVYCLRHYATFKGRASRSEFWWFYLVVLIGIGATYALRLIAPVAAHAIRDLWDLLLALPHLAVTTRRLHDVGRSFWWVAAFLIDFALVLLFELSNTGDSLATTILGLLAIVALFALLIILLYLLVISGDPKPNRYGDPPSHTP